MWVSTLRGVIRDMPGTKEGALLSSEAGMEWCVTGGGREKGCTGWERQKSCLRNKTPR